MKLAPAIGLLLAAVAGAGPTSGPATAPAATAPAATGPATTQVATTQAVVDADAVGPLERLAAAYRTAGPLHVVGDLAGQFDVAGRRQAYKLHVDGRTDGDGRFVHDAGYAGLIVRDGESAYLYDRRRDAYARLPAALGRRPADEMSESVVNVLLDENPALLLTLTDDPAALLRRAAKAIRLSKPPTASATQPAGGLVLDLGLKTVTLRTDNNGRIVGSVIDYSPLMAARHAAGVKAASATLTYGPATREPSPAGAFSWTPPATASEFDAGEELVRPTPATRPAAVPPGWPATTPSGS